MEKKPEILSWKSVNFTKKYINIGLCKHISQQKQLLDVTNGDCKISHIFTQLTSFKLIILVLCIKLIITYRHKYIHFKNVMTSRQFNGQLL